MHGWRIMLNRHRTPRNRTEDPAMLSVLTLISLYKPRYIHYLPTPSLMGEPCVSCPSYSRFLTTRCVPPVPNTRTFFVHCSDPHTPGFLPSTSVILVRCDHVKQTSHAPESNRGSCHAVCFTSYFSI